MSCVCGMKWAKGENNDKETVILISIRFQN